MEPVIQVCDVGRRFGHVRALRDVTLDVHAGEIVALLGDNGAGKSTLMNIMCGGDRPDEGEILVNGQRLTSLQEAQELGVGIVYQDLALAPHLTVAENMFLARERLRTGPLGVVRWLDRRRMLREATQAITDLGITTLRDTSLPVSQLSGGQRQVVAVARAMMWTRTAILLDEPTAALGPKQVGMVLDAIRAAARHMLAVVIVAHDIPRMLDLADRIVILRHGTIADDLSPQGLSVADVVQRMVGDEIGVGAGREDEEA